MRLPHSYLKDNILILNYSPFSISTHYYYNYCYVFFVSAQVQELRVSERTLKVRVKSLTNELAVYKRKAISAEHGRPMSRQNRPNSSRGSLGGSSFNRDR